MAASQSLYKCHLLSARRQSSTFPKMSDCFFNSIGSKNITIFLVFNCRILNPAQVANVLGGSSTTATALQQGRNPSPLTEEQPGRWSILPSESIKIYIICIQTLQQSVTSCFIWVFLVDPSRLIICWHLC